MTEVSTAANYGPLQGTASRPDDQQYLDALSLANTLAATQETSVTPERIANWRRVILYEWLLVRWGYEWNGTHWQD